MPRLDLLISPPGTGKTTYCVDQFRNEIEKTRSGIDSRSYFVLPSREHAGRIQNLLLKKGVSGFFNAHVLTFNDLAARFSAGSALPPPDSIRTAVIRAILAEEAAKENLSYFSRVAHAKGFARALSSFFGEMRRGLLSISEFEKWCQPLRASDKIFALKFRDLSILAKRYDAAIRERGYAEPEESFTGIPESGAAADLVIFDGFYRFAPSQLALIESIARTAGRLIVTLTAPADAPEHPEIFGHILETRRQLERLGFCEKWKSVHTQRQASATVILESPNIREEMRAVARDIRRLYRTESFHWSDCAVILRSIEPYRKVLQSAFEEFEVPVHVHERKKLVEQGLAQTALRFLRLIYDGWKEPDVAFVLRSGCRVRPGEEEAALELVRQARAAGVVEGREAWQALAVQEGLPAAAKDLLHRLLQEEGQMRAARNAPEFSRRLRAWLKALPDGGDALVREALERIFERFGGEPEGSFSPARAAEDLVDAIEAGLYSEKPRTRNRVQIYDVVMALPKEYKVVFVSGLAEKIFPKETTEEPVLKDAERRSINEHAGRAVFEERRTRFSGERYFFYMACSRARERLTLTYPTAAVDGRPVLPSIFIEDARLLGAATRRSVLETGPEFWESEQEMDKELALRRFAAEGPLVTDARLVDPAILRWFSEYDRPFSASSLEALVVCRFKYFASKVLKFSSRLEDREAAEQGTVFHNTLDKFFKSLTEAERSDNSFWVEARSVAARLLPFLDLEISENAYFRRMQAHSRAVLAAQMRRALIRFVSEEIQLRQERDFVPAYFEKEFGGAVPLDIEGLPVRGFIDRIDVSRDGKTAIVIDYKSTKTSFVSRIARGLELQMPLYWMAVEKMLGLRVAGVEHRHLKDGKDPERRGREEFGSIFGRSVWTEEQVQAVLRKTREDAGEAVRQLRRSDIAVRSKSCDLCDYSPICRFEKWKLIYGENA